jgi:hypothetical protein
VKNNYGIPHGPTVELSIFLLVDNQFRRVKACVFVNGVGEEMAVELMLGYGGNSALAGKIEEDALAVKEFRALRSL